LSFAPTVSVVIPALNEAANLPHVLPRIPADVHEVIVVDGHSVDDTVAVARALLPTVRVVEQPGRGKGDALRAGFTAARGDIIVALDADGSTRPEEIAAFVAALTDGTDFAKGSRFLRGGGTTDMPWYRRAGNLGFVALVRLLFGGAYTDLCYGYNALWRRIVPVLALDADGFEIETMMNVRALKAGLRVAEVPSFEDRRIAGTSNLRTIRDGWRVLCTILRERVTTLAEPAAMPHRGIVLPVYADPVAISIDDRGLRRPLVELSIGELETEPRSDSTPALAS
jgi:glycosyltransferase involved in cell wall biosynthesis